MSIPCQKLVNFYTKEEGRADTSLKRPSKPKRPAEKSNCKPPAKKKRSLVQEEEETEEESTTEESESFHSSGDDAQIDTGSLDREADLDEVSCFASDDASDWEVPVDSQTWRDFYAKSESSTNIREHYVANFHKCLLHAEGGAHSPEQAFIYARQVHKILEHLDPSGSDLQCLVRNQSLDFWDDFCSPTIQSKTLSGNAVKLYIRSLEMFISFISRDLFVKIPLPDGQKHAICRLLERLPTIHRHTAAQSTTRKVMETFSHVTQDDLREVQNTEASKTAIKRFGQALEGHVLDQNEFSLVRDFLITTVLIENG